MASERTFLGSTIKLSIALATTMFLSPNVALADLQIGAAAQVVNSVYASMASAQQQPFWLRTGLDVFQDELVVTAENSASRLLFKDSTQLSIGPTAQVKLDKFVFDPNPSTKRVTISFIKGVFRFVSGNFGQENYKIQTPSTFISLRGTAFTVYIADNGSELISVESGTIYVSCRGTGSTVAVNAGESTYIPARHSNPTQPTRSSPNPQVALMDTLLH